jgi:hypothetical protein
MIIYAGQKNIWLKTAKELILRKYKNKGLKMIEFKLEKIILPDYCRDAGKKVAWNKIPCCNSGVLIQEGSLYPDFIKCFCGNFYKHSKEGFYQKVDSVPENTIPYNAEEYIFMGSEKPIKCPDEWIEEKLPDVRKFFIDIGIHRQEYTELTRRIMSCILILGRKIEEKKNKTNQSLIEKWV